MRRVLVLVFAVLLLGGCGGGDDGGDPAGGASADAGKAVFTEAGCGGCHTLSDAGSSGTTGPNLDGLQPVAEQVAEQVKLGGNGMPAFAGQLSEKEIEEVAAYVAGVAGKGPSGPVGVQFEPDDTTLADCESDDEALCWEQAFGNLLYDEGPEKSLAELSQVLTTNKTVSLGCHRIVHRMGSAALKLFKDDVGLAFSKGDSVCSSGYYHGILERAFAGVPDAELPATAQKLCTTPSIADNEFLRFQCNHGLGHGLMITTHYELPRSLDVCEVLGGGYDTEACQGGTFMENGTSSYGYASKYLRDNDLIYPCDDVTEARKPACYILVTARILPAVNWDWQKAAEVCRQSEPGWIYMCFRSYGRDAISTQAYDQDIARDLCRNAKEYEADCVLSVALHIANEEGRVDGANRFCRDTPKDLRIACYAGLGVTAQLLIPEARQRNTVCKSITRNPVEEFACVSGSVPR